MPDDEQSKSDQVENARSSFQLAFSVMGQIGGLAIGVIIVAILGGVVLDRVLQTRPLFTLLLLLGSIPLTYFIIYRVAMNAVKKIASTAPKPPVSKEGGDVE